MRIGVVTTSYPRFPGDAAGHFVAGFAEWLAHRGADVDVLRAHPNRRLFYRGGAPEALSGPLLGAAPAGAWNRARGWLGAAHFTATLASAVRQRAASWDAMVSHWLLPSALICDHVGRRRGLRHLAIAHGSDVALLRRLRLDGRICRRLSRRSELVFVADALRPRAIPGRIVAMTSDAPPPLPSRSELRAQLNLSGFTVLFLGRLTHDKGIRLVAEAVRDLPVTLLVAGEGPLSGTLRPPANVRLLGAQYGRAKWELLHAADLLVVPSLTDAAPTVVREARALALCVLATPVGGIVAQAATDPGISLVAPTVEALRAALRTAAKIGTPRTASQYETWAECGARLWPADWSLPAAEQPGQLVITDI